MLPTKSDSRRRLNANASSRVDINKANGASEVDGFVNEQWATPDVEKATPWKTIAIIVTFFVVGFICICCAVLDWLADVKNERSDRIWALIILGALMFTPGGYYFYILSCILLRRQGFTMDDIRRLG